MDFSEFQHGLPALVKAARGSLASGQPLVLATIIGTEGSSYRKAGARMLLHPDGRATGLLGGGCFEGDLAERAAAILDGAPPLRVRYDMRSDGDTLWGLGLGCNGAVEIFLQRLEGEPEPLLDRLAHLSEHGGRLATVIESEREDLPAGHSWDQRDAQPLPEADGLVQKDGSLLFCTTVQPPPHLLICGAGPDAVPLAAMATVLGWRLDATDHRPAYADAGRLPGTPKVALFEGSFTDAARQADAVVVMSHHFEMDARYLERLTDHPARYLGVLGPRQRRDALIERLGEEGQTLEGRLHGPVGLDLGGELPENIALSILSEIQAALAGRAGRPLSPP